MANPQMLVKIVTVGEQLSVVVVSANDETGLAWGDDSDFVIILRSTALNANTALTGVLAGTPVTSALAADSAILSNITASGDILVAANRGGDSEEYIFIDSSAGALRLVAPAAAITLAPTTDVLIENGAGLVIGHTAQVAGNVISELQVLGTSWNDGSLTLGIWSISDEYPIAQFIKSKDGTVGSNTPVVNNDVIGALLWAPADGTDFATSAAQFHAEVDDGSPLAGDIGMAFVFKQMPGATGALTETWRMTASGQLISGGIADNPANVTADGSAIFEGGLAITDVANAHIDDATKGTGTVVHYIGNNTIDTTAPSDERLKADFVPYDGSVMEPISELEFQTYEYRPEGLREEYGRTFGLTAQAMEKSFPEYVFERSDGYSQIAYHKMVPVLLRAIQELQGRIQGLEAA